MSNLKESIIFTFNVEVVPSFWNLGLVVANVLHLSPGQDRGPGLGRHPRDVLGKVGAGIDAHRPQVGLPPIPRGVGPLGHGEVTT